MYSRKLTEHGRPAIMEKTKIIILKKVGKKYKKIFWIKKKKILHANYNQKEMEWLY